MRITVRENGYQMMRELRGTVFKDNVDLDWILAKETVARTIGGIRRPIMDINI